MLTYYYMSAHHRAIMRKGYYFIKSSCIYWYSSWQPLLGDKLCMTYGRYSPVNINLALMYVCRNNRWKMCIMAVPTLNMMTSSNGNIFRVTGPLCGEFTGPGEFPAKRPVTRSFDIFFDLRLNKWLSKQSWGWWFETLSRPLWRHCYDIIGCLRRLRRH